MIPVDVHDFAAITGDDNEVPAIAGDIHDFAKIMGKFLLKGAAWVGLVWVASTLNPALTLNGLSLHLFIFNLKFLIKH